MIQLKKVVYTISETYITDTLIRIKWYEGYQKYINNLALFGLWCKFVEKRWNVNF